jgi:hypothetical protein
MDPYLEATTIWPGVHTSLVAIIRELLSAQVSPEYFVDVVFVPDVVTYASGVETIKDAEKNRPL